MSRQVLHLFRDDEHPCFKYGVGRSIAPTQSKSINIQNQLSSLSELGPYIKHTLLSEAYAPVNLCIDWFFKNHVPHAYSRIKTYRCYIDRYDFDVDDMGMHTCKYLEPEPFSCIYGR